MALVTNDRHQLPVPLGKSVTKRGVGDAILVQRPLGEIEVELLSIVYEEEPEPASQDEEGDE